MKTLIGGVAQTAIQDPKVAVGAAAVAISGSFDSWLTNTLPFAISITAGIVGILVAAVLIYKHSVDIRKTKLEIKALESEDKTQSEYRKEIKQLKNRLKKVTSKE